MKKILSIILIALAAVSCSKKDDSPEPKKQTDVYAIITEYSPIEQSYIWKNGTKTLLGKGKANRLFVSNNDVYVIGKETQNGKDIIKFWKNGSPSMLTDGQKDAYATGIYVLGNDVYISGFESKSGVYLAKCWKNGVATVLNSDETKTGQANSVFVSGTDVYVAGYENNGAKKVAKYWKNGTAITLSDGNYNEGGNSIFVSGGDVYVAGFRLDNGKYIAKMWENGVATELTDAGAVSSWTSSICAYNGKVYIAGRVGGYATLWANNKPINLGSDRSAYDICIKDGNVFLSGVNSVGGKYKATMWKNEIETLLTDGSAPSDANGIFVK